jgi:hypothetical protein
MTIGFELVLCAILVVSSGMSLAIFMDTLNTSQISTTNQNLVRIAQDNDNGSNNNDKNKNVEFLF